MNIFDIITASNSITIISFLSQNLENASTILFILFDIYKGIQHAVNIFYRSIKQLGSTFDAGQVILARMIPKATSYSMII